MMPVCWWLEYFIAFFMGLELSIFMVVCFLNDVEGWCEMRKRKSLDGVMLSGVENGDIRWFNKSYTREMLKGLNVLSDFFLCLYAAFAFYCFNKGEKLFLHRQLR